MTWFLDLYELKGNEFMYVITVPSEEHLVSHFYERARYSVRSAERYVKNADRIMRIREHLVERAREFGRPCLCRYR